VTRGGPDQQLFDPKLTVFLTDLQVCRTVRGEFMDTSRPPACSPAWVVGQVHPEFRVEVEALAVVSA
jgi:enamine deaminase RidA (YjgF/YER057c/UK114 family)